MAQPDTDTPWEPIAPASTPIGSMAPRQIQSNSDELPKLFAIAAKLLQDPLQVERLAKRVYQLMQEDLQLQRERQGYYGGRR